MKRDADNNESFFRVRYGIIENCDPNVNFRNNREASNINGLDIETVENDAGIALPPSIPQTPLFKNQQQFLEELELKKIAHGLAVPTNDDLVKARLKELGEPIILFGENRVDRRARLRMELARRRDMRCLPIIALQNSPVLSKNSVISQQTSEGPQDLAIARKKILYIGFERASMRLNAAQLRMNYLKGLTSEQYDEYWERLEKNLYQPMSEMEPVFSIVGDNRPLTSISCNKDGSALVSASWSSNCKLWNEVGECVQTWKGHTERVLSAKFHPEFFIDNLDGSSDSSVVHMASSAADYTIRLWNATKSQSIGVLTGHTDRVNKVSWHPTGVWLVAASHDLHWSLWDVERQKLLVRQDGHSLPVNCVSWHVDGTLVATGASDAMCVVWDVRLGKSIQFFKGHVKQVLSVDWHPAGVLLASASEDNSLKIWDLRISKLLYTIPAHEMLISDVKFAPNHGLYLVSSSFDSTVKIWRSEDWSLVSVLRGHDSKVFSVDVISKNFSDAFDQCFEESHLSTQIVSAGFDRTWKLWNVAMSRSSV